jgi:Protein of unknown function (DUF1186)/SEC-C motif
MEPIDILRALRDAKDFPKAALIAAADRRAEMTPLLLRELDEVLAAPDPARASSAFFLFHLFGEWREKAACRPLMRLLRLPSEPLDELLGDALDTTSRRVVAAVFDGDPQPLFAVVLDADAHPHARAAVLEAIAVLTLRGEIARPVAEGFLRDAFTNIRPQGESFVWWGWQSAIAALGMTGLRDLVATAFARGFINRVIMRYPEFEEDLQRALEHPSDPWANDLETRNFSPFGSTVEELADWAWFDPATEHARTGTDDHPPPNREGGYWSQAQIPRASPFKKLGRNDPCPCGSGKKYKKCCMRVGT